MDFGTIFSSWLVGILVVNGLLAFIPAFIAKEKGRSFAAFWFLSFLTTILIGLIAVLAMPSVSPELRAKSSAQIGRGIPEFLKCPYCAEFIKSEARVCKHCGKDVEAEFADAVDRANNESERLRRESQETAVALALKNDVRKSERREKFRALFRSKWFRWTVLLFSAVSIFSIVTFAVIENEAKRVRNDAQAKLTQCERRVPQANPDDIGLTVILVTGEKASFSNVGDEDLQRSSVLDEAPGRLRYEAAIGTSQRFAECLVENNLASVSEVETVLEELRVEFWGKLIPNFKDCSIMTLGCDDPTAATYFRETPSLEYESKSLRFEVQWTVLQNRWTCLTGGWVDEEKCYEMSPTDEMLVHLKVELLE